MKKTGSDVTEVEEKSMPETDKISEKELSNSNDDGQSQLRDKESLGTTDADMEDSQDKAVRETLSKDQAEGVRENSDVEPNGEGVGQMKGSDSNKEVVAGAIVPVSEVTVQNREVETSPRLTALSNPSMVEPSVSSDPPVSAAHGLSLVSVPTTQEQRSISQVNNSCLVSPALRSPGRDGYNWRKYGQKQVKSPKGSRSYYRCTHSACCAKKIECSSDSGNMIEIVNKGLHSHEPPRKKNLSPREIIVASAIPPVAEDKTIVEKLAIVPSGSDPSASTKHNICESPTMAARKRHRESIAVDEPKPKQRQKKDNSKSLDSVSKPGKKNKIVVHAAADVGISGDGYRWRKYGQKMVKGNPNPRNYYRCTSAACHVRKHIETSVENTTSVIITYKGVHSHDKPVPKKRHGPPSSMLVAAAAPTSMRTRPDDEVNMPTSSQCSGGRESEKQSI